MTCAPVPSRLACTIVPAPKLAQYRWLASTATPTGKLWPEAMTCAPVPSRLASTIVPALMSAQYRWRASTATPAGSPWPEAMTCAPVPSRLAFTIVPALPLAQYRWLAEAPVPVSESVARTAFLLLAAVSVAAGVPVRAGANRTVTVHDVPGPRLVAVQVSAVMVNAADPDSVTVTARLALPPVLASVTVWAAAWPTVTCPKSNGDGLNASTGGPALAAAAPTATPSTATAAPAATAARRIRLRIAAPLPHHVPDRSPPGTGAAGWRVARPGRQ